jgi:hypothetical protein
VLGIGIGIFWFWFWDRDRDRFWVWVRVRVGVRGRVRVRVSTLHAERDPVLARAGRGTDAKEAGRAADHVGVVPELIKWARVRVGVRVKGEG